MKWYHALMVNTLTGEHVLIGCKASNEDHVQKLAYFHAHKYFGDEGMFYMLLDFLSEMEAEATGLDEF